jgi:hypothetical protein
MATEAGKKRGRPRKLALGGRLPVAETLEKLAAIKCTRAEAAYVLDVTAPTLSALFREHPEIAAAWRRGKVIATMSTRRLVWWHAQQPNAGGVRVAMALARRLVWNNEIERPPADGAGGVAFGPKEAFAALSDAELSFMIEIQKKASHAVSARGLSSSNAARWWRRTWAGVSRVENPNRAVHWLSALGGVG